MNLPKEKGGPYTEEDATEIYEALSFQCTKEHPINNLLPKVIAKYGTRLTNQTKEQQ